MSSTKTITSWAKALALALALAFAATLALASAPAAYADVGGDAPDLVAGIAAQDDATSGIAGVGVTWSLQDGVLTVTGEDGATVPAITDWTDSPSDFSKLVISGANLSLAANAFKDQTSIAQIKLPNAMNSIGNSAFWGCSGMAQAKLPSVIHTLGSNIFQNCANLEKATIAGADQETPLNIAGQFDVAKVLGYCYGVSGGIGSNGPGGFAFGNCNKLSTVVFDDGTDAIFGDYGMVLGSTSLKGIIFPSSLVYLSPMFFANSDYPLYSLEWLYFKGDVPQEELYSDGMYFIDRDTWEDGAFENAITIYCPEEYKDNFENNQWSNGGVDVTVIVVPSTVSNAEAAIAALPDAADVTIEHDDAITATRAAYEKAIADGGIDSTMKSWLDEDKLLAAESALKAAMVTKVDKPQAAAGLVYSGEQIVGVTADNGYKVEGGVATNAGNYIAKATLLEGYVWADDSTEPLEIEWSIAKAQAIVPEAKTGLVYNGKNQTGVAAGEGYSVSEGSATDAGSYSAIVTADANYVFADGATTATVNWSIAKAAQTVTVSKASVSKTYGAKAFLLGAKTNGGGKLTYESSNKKVATVSATGKVTVKGAGQAKITVKAAASTNYKASAAKYVTVKVAKAANSLAVKAVKATQTAKVGKATTIKAAKAFKVTKNTGKGKVTYKKISGNAKITVSSTGKITVKKGLKKGKTYTIKVKAMSAATANYKAATSKAITIKVKVQ